MLGRWPVSCLHHQHLPQGGKERAGGKEGEREEQRGKSQRQTKTVQKSKEEKISAVRFSSKTNNYLFTKKEQRLKRQTGT